MTKPSFLQLSGLLLVSLFIALLLYLLPSRPAPLTPLIILPEEAGPMNRLAAQELALHLGKAIGSQPQTISETSLTDSPPGRLRIFLGPTMMAKQQGIDVEALGEEEALIQMIDGDLYLAARRELPRSQKEIDTVRYLSGELVGVYEFLERFIGVRWLWPGETGTVIPAIRRLHLPETLHLTVKLPLSFRGMRWDSIREAVFSDQAYTREAEEIGFSREGLRHYGNALRDYLRRHRMTGNTRKPKVGHAFNTWWKAYGATHPEWFMLNSKGERGPEPDASPFAKANVSMCVSNESLHRTLTQTIWDGGDLLRLGESDSRQFCHCERCAAWDHPVHPPEELPASLRETYQATPITSNRYSRFWEAVAKQATQRNPNVTITTFLYLNYFPAPTTKRDLSAIMADFCPWGDNAMDHYPMTPEVDQWVKAQWEAWRKTGARLVYRPNHMAKGNYMPYLNLHQTAAFFQFAYQRGMTGTDYDTLTGQWAVHGPEIYLQARLFNHPEKAIDDLLSEYYSAFGDAAGEVKVYFDYWERHALKLVNGGNHERLRRTPSIYKTHELFPPSVFSESEKLLEKAESAVEKETQEGERVAFLRLGWQHAEMVARLSAAFNGIRTISPQTPGFKEAQQLVRELSTFRKRHESTFFSDFYTPGWDRKAWDMNALLGKPPSIATPQEEENNPALAPHLRDTR